MQIYLHTCKKSSNFARFIVRYHVQHYNNKTIQQ